MHSGSSKKSFELPENEKKAKLEVCRKVLKTMLSELLSPDTLQSQELACIAYCCCSHSQWFSSVTKLLIFCKENYGINVTPTFGESLLFQNQWERVYLAKTDMKKVTFKVQYGADSGPERSLETYKNLIVRRTEEVHTLLKDFPMARDTKTMFLLDVGVWLRFICQDYLS